MLAIAAMNPNVPTAFSPHASTAAAQPTTPWPTNATMPPPTNAMWTPPATAAPSPTTISHKRAHSIIETDEDPSTLTMGLPTKKFASEEAVAAHLARLRLSGGTSVPPRRAGARDHDSILADPASVLLRHPKRKLSARLLDDEGGMDVDTPTAPERKWDARVPSSSSPRPPRAKARRTGASPARPRSRSPISPVPEGGAVTLYRRGRSPVTDDTWTDAIHRFLALDDATLVAAWRVRAPARLGKVVVSPDAIRAALREAAASASGKRRLLALAGAADEDEDEEDASTGQIEELPDDWDGMLTDDLVVSNARPVVIEADDNEEEDEAPRVPSWNASGSSSSSAWNGSSPKIIELPPSPERSPPYTSASWADTDPDAMDVDE
ncbi:hypothetical protein AMAG_11606 [Allomyces macrogynus ATCC 38327]|uniref:Uncharacterized protein n=1 Tax=Allomyces macrogynus (strain ATCC 38327) TaxID=578462 RepID=A0A0L0SVX0_ALLM3|nr:hypothetical protein AMAG_11606 [Allomyces macrogynus ATCC 38327]|eukprot:KNE66469.1 hypothetical protein AMAG_11606 [Allomyces macrogynus ATCC 38327]